VLALTTMLLVVCGAWQAGCSEGDAARGGETPKAAPQPVVEVEVMTAVPEARAWRIPIVGTLAAAEQAIISTKTAGILRRTFVDVGGIVAPGDPLAQVDRVDYDVAAEQARASLAEVLARLGVAEVPDESFDLKRVSAVARAAAQLENARFTSERLTRMGTAYSEQELNDASTQLRVAEANHQLAVDEAAALVATARERHSLLRMAEQKLTETLTQAPPIPSTRGEQGADQWIVAARLVTEGQYVNVGDQLYRLLVTDPLKLRSRVPERYAGDVKPGLQVELERVEDHRQLAGRIVRISPSVDPASRTFEIEAVIDNKGGELMPGAFAIGAIVPDATRQAIYLPSNAVLTSGGVMRVFVVEEGAAKQRPIQTGRQEEGLVEVVSGLREGERVVTRGAAILTDGMAVQVRPSS